MTPAVSVVIPTYDRPVFLAQALQFLGRQSLSPDSFEVIVIDDGSPTEVEEAVRSQRYPFSLQIHRQSNQGDAEARNLGAKVSRGRVLVFIDDDVLVHPDYLRQLVKHHEQDGQAIVVGTQYLWLNSDLPSDDVALPSAKEMELVLIRFPDVCSNNMSLLKDDYISLGMMQSLGFAGSDIWCDVDLSYRAYRRGFRFVRNPKAVCWHRDYVAQSLKESSRRMHEVALRAAYLFEKYPELQAHLPMFEDKTAICWAVDSCSMAVRKLARRVTSSGPVLSVLEGTHQAARIVRGPQELLDPLTRWIIGGYTFRGYRRGLKQVRGSKQSVQPEGRPQNRLS